MIRHVLPWKATGAGDMTILRAPGRRLAKRITPAGVEDYDGASLFEVEALRLDGVDDFPTLLEERAPRTDSCVIRGVLKPEFAARRQVLRRIHDAPSAMPGHVVAAPFVAIKRCWAMLDVEPSACPGWIDPTDPLLVGGWLRRQLPAPFQMARCVVQLSSGAGIKPGLRAHLWFWLSRALDKPELDRWLKGVPGIDLSVFVAVQPHYCASPIFVDGAEDPCHERLAVLPGLDVVEVPLRSEPRPRQAFSTAEARPYVAPARGLSFKATRAEKYMLRCLEAIAAAEHPQRHPTFVRISVRLYGLAKGGALDPRDVEARVLGAVGLSSFDRDRAEVVSALRWAWEHSEPWKLP